MTPLEPRRDAAKKKTEAEERARQAIRERGARATHVGLVSASGRGIFCPDST